MNVKIVAYDDKHLFLSNGNTIDAPEGYSYDVNDIKKILEAGETDENRT